MGLYLAAKRAPLSGDGVELELFMDLCHFAS